MMIAVHHKGTEGSNPSPSSGEAFAYIGGCPKKVIPDNLKTGVTDANYWDNVVILGPTGSGKSFLACAIGNQAAGGFSVRYQRLTRLLDELALARVDGKATRLLAQLGYNCS